VSWATEHIERLQQGETVTFKPRGRSMEPVIKDGQEVTVEPAPYGNGVSKGDVVLCRVGRFDYLHFVKQYDKKQHRFQIGNNKGRINGWIEADFIYGRMVR
jgi:hypothetical protein